jgi:hypothetical protein
VRSDIRKTPAELFDQGLERQMILPRAAFIAFAAAGLALPAQAAGAEFFCAKPETKSWDDNTTVACYSDAGCAYAAQLGAYVARDYDLKSVVAALGREKIEGVVTSSTPITTAIKRFGYVCEQLPD